MKLQCPACASDRVAEGRFCQTEGPCRFELPSQGTGFFATFGPSFDLDPPAFACVQCGLVWAQADKVALKKGLASGGNDELLEGLGIPAHPKRRWLWLLFGRH